MPPRSSPGESWVGLAGWLLFWSLGVGFISAMIPLKGGLFLLVAVPYGIVELILARLLSESLTAAATASVPPPRITQDLASLTAAWGAAAPTRRLHQQAGLLLLLLAVLIGGGTWLPAYLHAAEEYILLSALISLIWSPLAWMGWRTLQHIARAREAVSLTATLDALTVTRTPLWGPPTTHAFPAAQVQATAHTDHLRLTGPDTVLEVPCPPSRERVHLAQTFNRMASLAATAPADQPPVPAALAKLRRERT